MADEEYVNPFLEPQMEPGVTPERPGSQLAQEKGKKIRDMGPSVIPNAQILTQVNPKIPDLTQQDLEDLALEMAGLDSYNPKVKRLTKEDLRDIEAIFFEVKLAGIRSARSQGAQPSAQPQGEVELQFFDDISCCSCTPCCCCAAADVDPFESETPDEV